RWQRRSASSSPRARSSATHGTRRRRRRRGATHGRYEPMTYWRRSASPRPYNEATPNPRSRGQVTTRPEQLRGLIPLGRVSLAALLTVGAAAILLVATIVVGQVSATGFVVLGVAFVLLLAAASWRWPRVVLMAVVLSPILDRYIVAGLVPASLGFVAHITSEALLAGVAIVIGVRGW